MIIITLSILNSFVFHFSVLHSHSYPAHVFFIFFSPAFQMKSFIGISVYINCRKKTQETRKIRFFLMFSYEIKYKGRFRMHYVFPLGNSCELKDAIVTQSRGMRILQFFFCFPYGPKRALAMSHTYTN